MPVLPPHRVLEQSKLDHPDDPAWFYAVPSGGGDHQDQEAANEDRYEEVAQAICSGRQVRCDSTGDDANLREVCTTRFVDPETQEWRFAVEVWNGFDSGKHDFAAEEDAAERHRYYCERLRL